MEFLEAVKKRRSIRKYNATPIPENVIEKAMDAALIAPNSSNMQTWRMYWVRTPEKKSALVHACFNQGAAKTAQELIVFTADPTKWKITQKALLEHFGEKAHPDLIKYYTKMMPHLYSRRWLAPIKWLTFNLKGISSPSPRRPWSARDIQEVSIKSTALACENFMLAIAAQGFDTCPMEGFDERRVARLLKLGCYARVVMVISVGQRDEKVVLGEQFRLPRDVVFQKV